LEKLLTEADVVSLHVPLTEITHFMVNEEFLQKMKPSAHLINNSRGPVVEQQALKNALQQNIIAGAALDVFESEPPDDLEFLDLPNLMVTPHIGGSANEAILAMGRSAISHLKKHFQND
jgi:D-3-phosphoglycerate dehydrogenase